VSRKRDPAIRRRTAFGAWLKIRPVRGPGLQDGFVIASIFAALTGVWSPDCLHASEASQTSAPTSSDTASQADAGPKRLKQQVRVTVETNAPALEATTNAANLKPTSFHWKFSWEGWNGPHYEVSKRTPIKEPLTGIGAKMLADFRDKIQGTNTDRIFHLEEAKMSGKIGARLQVDGAAYVTGNQFKGFDDGFEVRRFRVYTQGDCLLLLPVSYELELGYIPNQFYIENSYLAFRDLPWIGELKFGQYQAPMGLDAVTSSRDTTMMELAAPLEALAPGVNAGIEIGQPVFDKRATWTMGLFTSGSSQDTGDASKNYGRAITRFTALPLFEANPDHPDSATLLHLGLSANVLYSGSSSVRYRSRPESHLAPYVVDTGNIAADSALVAGAEAAWVKGPFSLQSEYMHSWVNEKDGQAPGFDGVYASVSYFLTGESRPYDRQNGCFTRVIPHNNFDWFEGGWGAWEVAGRYSFVNLDSANVHGGRLSMLMTGVNWYVHSHVKWRFEYGLGHVTDRQPEGNVNIFQTRVEVDF
jgi:phosphate-selective porin OprO/OprP